MLVYEENMLRGDIAVRREILTLGFLMNEINLERKYTWKRTVMVWDPAAHRGSTAEGTAGGSLLWTRWRTAFVWVPVCQSLPDCHLLLSYWEPLTRLTASYQDLIHGTFCTETMFVIPTAQGNKTLFPSAWLLWSPKDRVVSRTCFADLSGSSFH